jgi:hypothetical protein
LSKSKRLARLHKLSLELNLGSEDELVEKCARIVVRRAHPDKGGNTADIQRLQNARETWHSLRGRATGPQPEPLARVGEKSKASFQVKAQAVLLTYQGVSGNHHNFLATHHNFDV